MQLHQMNPDAESRWITFENPSGGKNSGGKLNRGAKGHAFESVEPGEEKMLFTHQGSGMINRIWCTVNDCSPLMLRSLLLRMWWDDGATPAVECPLGDFFCAGLGHAAAFENELFFNPEGRSFNSFISMPFRKSAKITLVNESKTRLDYLFYEISVVYGPVENDALYFHCWFNRKKPETPGEDYAILPLVRGAGRYLGATFGIMTDPAYKGSWWGEGEVKAYLDDDECPTLVGTGLEDYLGTGWGLGMYQGRFHGCLKKDEQEDGKWVFYRFHLNDPVYFHSNIRVTVQQMGGASYDQYAEIAGRGARLCPVSLDQESRLYRLFEEDWPACGNLKRWVNFYRCDDYSSAVYFYLDKPCSSLGAVISADARTAGL